MIANPESGSHTGDSGAPVGAGDPGGPADPGGIGGPAGAGSGIAQAATARTAGDDVAEPVMEPLRAYVRGHATGDPAHFRRAFLAGAHIEGLRDGAFVSWSLDDYCALFNGRPAPDESARSRHLDAVDVRGTVATATMTLWHGADTFTDIFLLVRVDGHWRIANKVYHRSTRGDDRSLSG